MNAFLQRYALGVALILLFLVGISGYFMIVFREQAQAQAEEKELLAAQLREINEEQKTAIITRRVSSQLEEIAYQQKAISDAQKLEAENQKLIAEQMRDHAELEREKAIVAQQAALEAYEEMDAQKRIAEARREEAVMAQMRADSLARLALARSLGVQATKQYEADNEPLAALLSYAAWKFTAENQGDLYSPDIYKALSLCCKLSNIEVMGRDVSIVSTNTFSQNPVVRSIINSDYKINTESETVRYDLKPHKTFIFDKKTEERIYFEV